MEGPGKEWVTHHPLLAAKRGAEQGGSSRSWLKGFRDLFQGTGWSGENQLMTEAVTAIEALSGKRVLVLASSSASVEVLRAQGFTNAETLQQFQVNSNEHSPMAYVAARGAHEPGKGSLGFRGPERYGFARKTARCCSLASPTTKWLR